jgi:predicted transcriptional regulator
MEDTLVTFETAKLAREKGFEQDPNYLRKSYYNYKGELNGDVSDYLKSFFNHKDTKEEVDKSLESINAPTQSLLQKWLREVHNIIITIDHVTSKGWCYRIQVKNSNWSNFYKCYELALEDGLQEALKLI